MNSKVTTYLNKPSQWKSAMIALRTLLMEAGLEESLKWGKPCYAYNDKNVVIIQAFKEHCDLGFFNGALLKDEKKLLIKAGVNTQAGRQLRFTSVQEIEHAKPIIKAYLKEAIANEKSGKKFVAETNSEKMIVEELDAIFAKNKTLKKAFDALTPGRQRAYLLFFAAA